MSTRPPPERTRREVLGSLAATLALAACTDTTAGTGAGTGGADAPGGAGALDASVDDVGGADGTTAAALDASKDVAATDAADSAAADTAEPDTAAADTAEPDTGGGLPTAQEVLTPVTKNEYFFVTTYSNTPTVEAETWSVAVQHEGQPLGSFGWTLLQSLPTETHEHTLECISAAEHAQKISNAIWTGTPLGKVLQAAGIAVPKDAVYIAIEGADGYTTSIPVGDLNAPTWLVWKMNGAPLPAAHGYPARMLVPGRYGMKSPKWLTKLNFVKADELGFWEAAGWDNAAIVNPNVFVRYPEKWETLKAGPLRIGGTAFAGSDPVVEVEVQVSGGAWQKAVIDHGPGADVWTLWHVDLVAQPGVLMVQTRCKTASGKVSAIPFSDGPAGYDGAMLAKWAVL